MREKLEAIKKRIVDGKQMYYELAKEKKEVMNLVNDYIKIIKGDISDETGPDGKPTFSNQAKRDAEFVERTENDKKYKQMLERLEEVQEKSTQLELDIESAVYDFKIEDILSRLS